MDILLFGFTIDSTCRGFSFHASTRRVNGTGTSTVLLQVPYRSTRTVVRVQYHHQHQAVQAGGRFKHQQSSTSKRSNNNVRVVRVIYQAPRSRVRVDTAGEDEAEPQARPSTSWPDPPVHGDEGPDINRVVWSEMNATASGLYGS